MCSKNNIDGMLLRFMLLLCFMFQSHPNPLTSKTPYSKAQSKFHTDIKQPYSIRSSYSGLLSFNWLKWAHVVIHCLKLSKLLCLSVEYYLCKRYAIFLNMHSFLCGTGWYSYVCIVCIHIKQMFNENYNYGFDNELHNLS